MKRKVREGKQSRPVLWHHPSIRLEWLRKPTKTSTRADILRTKSLEYEAGARHSVGGIKVSLAMVIVGRGQPESTVWCDRAKSKGQPTSIQYFIRFLINKLSFCPYCTPVHSRPSNKQELTKFCLTVCKPHQQCKPTPSRFSSTLAWRSCELQRWKHYHYSIHNRVLQVEVFWVVTPCSDVVEY